jgi:hypothetical protein
MPSFFDRERAFEAHDALIRQEAFLSRMRSYKRLGLALAGRVDKYGADAESFARGLAEACAVERSDQVLCRRISRELVRHNLYLFPAEILKMLGTSYH